MKSASYITRLFKGYKIVSSYTERTSDNIGKIVKSTWYRFKLTKRDSVNCIYDIYIIDDSAVLTAKQRREQAQAKELIKALQALPKYKGE